MGYKNSVLKIKQKEEKAKKKEIWFFSFFKKEDIDISSKNIIKYEKIKKKKSWQ